MEICSTVTPAAEERNTATGAKLWALCYLQKDEYDKLFMLILEAECRKSNTKIKSGKG